jgi:hypothetical protein
MSDLKSGWLTVGTLRVAQTEATTCFRPRPHLTAPFWLAPNAATDNIGLSLKFAIMNVTASLLW